MDDVLDQGDQVEGNPPSLADMGIAESAFGGAEKVEDKSLEAVERRRAADIVVGEVPRLMTVLGLHNVSRENWDQYMIDHKKDLDRELTELQLKHVREQTEEHHKVGETRYRRGVAITTPSEEVVRTVVHREVDPAAVYAVGEIPGILAVFKGMTTGKTLPEQEVAVLDYLKNEYAPAANKNIQPYRQWKASHGEFPVPEAPKQNPAVK